MGRLQLTMFDESGASAVIEVKVVPSISHLEAILLKQFPNANVSLDRQRDNLLGLIAQIRVGERPRRSEPRVRKRRPKPYPWLKVPRALARQQIHELGYFPNG